MKLILLNLILVLATLNLNAESGPDNGTDYVKILFADAQYSLNSSLTSIEEKDLKTLGLDASTLSWLNIQVENSSRFSRIKFYLRKMDLKFQTEACTDGSGRYASICFFRNPEPFVLISLKENKMTTKEQAMAMLIHEAGHLTGETDHLFLDKVGVQLASALKAPKVLIVDRQNTEIVPNIFTAKEACDNGTSVQAQQLKQHTLADLQLQCSQRQLTCDLSKTNFIFQGTAVYVNGRGYTMEVSCALRAVLNLR